jgi:hypothetical protein
VVAAAGLGAAVVHLLRTPRPLLDLRTLRVATYRVTALGGSVFRAVITAVPFLLPLFLQLGFGWNAAEAGLVVIALFVGCCSACSCSAGSSGPSASPLTTASRSPTSTSPG